MATVVGLLAGEHTFYITFGNGNERRFRFSIKESHIFTVSQTIAAILGETSDNEGCTNEEKFFYLSNGPTLVIDGGYYTVGLVPISRGGSVDDSRAESDTNHAMKNVNIAISQAISEYRTDIMHYSVEYLLAQGLFAAYAMRKSLPIGTVNPYAPLIRNDETGDSRGEGPMFGLGSSQSEILKRDRYGYGWQIRGPHREFIIGSVINISISKAEILPVIEEAWQNGHRLATFLKALIRKNLAYGEQAVAPRLEMLQRVMSEYMVLQNSKKLKNIGPRIHRRSSSTSAIKVVRTKNGKRARLEEVPSQSELGVPTGVSETAKAFNFKEKDLSPSEPRQGPNESHGLSQRSQNPLLAEI